MFQERLILCPLYPLPLSSQLPSSEGSAREMMRIFHFQLFLLFFCLLPLPGERSLAAKRLFWFYFYFYFYFYLLGFMIPVKDGFLFCVSKTSFRCQKSVVFDKARRWCWVLRWRNESIISSKYCRFDYNSTLFLWYLWYWCWYW